MAFRVFDEGLFKMNIDYGCFEIEKFVFTRKYRNIETFRSGVQFALSWVTYLRTYIRIDS